MTRLGLIVGVVFVLLGAAIVAFAAFAESTGARADCSTLDVAAHGRVADGSVGPATVLRL